LWEGNKMDLTDLRDKAAIVGVGYTDEQGTVPGRSAMSFAMEASKNAIEDAGLKLEDIDGLLIQPTIGQQSYTTAATLGLDNLRLLANEDVMGASAACLTNHAALAVLSGQANYVLVLYGTNSRSGRRPGGGGAPYGSGPAYGVFGAATEYALAARRGCTNSAQVWTPGLISQYHSVNGLTLTPGPLFTRGKWSWMIIWPNRGLPSLCAGLIAAWSVTADAPLS